MSAIAVEKKLANLSGYDYGVMLGRARSGLVALIEVFQNGEAGPLAVVIPENICPVVATAIRAGGGVPVPVAVSPVTGLTDDRDFVQVMKRIDPPGIVMPAHLYGFLGNYPETVKYAGAHGWFIVENDSNAIRMASAPFGDALLVSFGYAKPITIGRGGAILTNDATLARRIRHRVSSYDLLDSAAQMREEQCMLGRRAMRATLDTGSAELARICAVETDLCRFRFDDKDSDRLLTTIDHFPAERARRIERRHLWDRALTPLEDILLPPALTQPVPWRLIRRITQKRDHFARHLRDNGIDAGINYRSVHRELPPDYLIGTPFVSDPWGDTVLNLWLTRDYDQARIEKAADILKETANDL